MTTWARYARRLGWLLGPVLLLVVAACRPSTRDRAPSYAVSVPECQHSWGPYIAARGDSVLAPDQLSLAKGITNIPEFHDCQRFIVLKGDTLRYDSLFAIFGAWDLGVRYDSIAAHHDSIPPAGAIQVDSVGGVLAASTPVSILITSVAGAAPSQSPSSARAWGLTEIYAEGGYAPLGIAPGFNCAYFYYAGATLQAKMVNYGRKEQDCSLPVDPTRILGRVLEVRRVQHPDHRSPDDYPAAARWDWDAADTIQYFGVKCGDAWCEVGPEHFTPSTLPETPTTPLPVSMGTSSGTPPAWHRVVHIKGWFDEQQLAPGAGTNPRRPAVVRGTAFPDPLLDLRRIKDVFRRTWISTAWIAIDQPEVGYGDKLNLLPVRSTAGPGMNHVELCWGTWEACVESPSAPPPGVAEPCAGPDPYSMEIPEDHGRWWARITSRTGTEYRCVRRRDHADVRPISRGTVRWRWRANDEIIWQSCAAGCCEVEIPD